MSGPCSIHPPLLAVEGCRLCSYEQPNTDKDWTVCLGVRCLGCGRFYALYVGACPACSLPRGNVCWRGWRPRVGGAWCWPGARGSQCAEAVGDVERQADASPWLDTQNVCHWRDGDECDGPGSRCAEPLAGCPEGDGYCEDSNIPRWCGTLAKCGEGETGACAR